MLGTGSVAATETKPPEIARRGLHFVLRPMPDRVGLIICAHLSMWEPQMRAPSSNLILPFQGKVGLAAVKISSFV